MAVLKNSKVVSVVVVVVEEVRGCRDSYFRILYCIFRKVMGFVSRRWGVIEVFD